MTFPIQGTLPAADWTGFSRALDELKTRLIRELPGHTELLTQLRAQAEAARGIVAPTPTPAQTRRPTVPLPGQTVRPEIRFSPGVLSEAHIF